MACCLSLFMAKAYSMKTDLLEEILPLTGESQKMKELSWTPFVQECQSNAQSSFSLKKYLIHSRFWLIPVLTLVLLLTAAVLAFVWNPAFEQWNEFRLQSVAGKWLMAVSLTLLGFQLGFLGYLFLMHKKYKARESVSDEDLPTCAVIVPAYNESKLVYKTLMKLAESNYPAEKLQIICIDDGSGDDTWEWIKRARQQIGSGLSIYQQTRNMGKRHALYRGFQLSSAEVWVTVDSDSLVKADTLRNLVSPMVHNPEVGAVAGNIRVLNHAKGVIPKMLSVSFVYSFEFIRSAQSVTGSVLCTPGALSAYRRSTTLPVLDEWMNQTFMGKPCDIGEDRAMTNLLLSRGYEVHFQRNAVVYTDTPIKFRNLCKMFIRWERSNVRENLNMTSYIFKNFRKGPKSGARLLFVNQWLNMLTTYPFLLFMLVFAISRPELFVVSTLLGVLIFSSLPAIFYARRHSVAEAFWAYSYGVFYAFALFWISPYAMATAAKRGWLTRSL